MTRSSRGRLAVHGHFYQPPREDPFSGLVPREPEAAPFHDWNERIDAECYRPNAERGSFRHISFDLGPRLAHWLEVADPATHEAIVAAGAASGDAMALPYHHTILPLASLRDRRTEIRWGLRDFEHRFGRRAAGVWLPEAAVDLPTLRLLAEAGVRYTILAPWQAAEPHLDPRRPYRVAVGDGLTIAVAFYDAEVSGAVSFDPTATADADRFARDRVLAGLAGTPFPDGTPGLLVVATDGELYGHHQVFRDLFLQRLVSPGPHAADRGFDVVSLAAAMEEEPDRPFPPARIQERTSWSCHHGVARWGWECPDAHDGRWKAPLRAALGRLAAGIDAASVGELAALAAPAGATGPGGPGALDLWVARDAYADVVVGAATPDAFARARLGDGAPEGDRRRLLELLEAQRWRLAMFASDAWFWDDPIRPETRGALRAAARAARLLGGPAGSALEERLLDDLALFSSPSTRLDGAAIYRRALAEVGQPPAPAGGGPRPGR